MADIYRPLNVSVSVHPDANTRVSSDVLRITENGQSFATVEVGDSLVRVIFLSYSPDALRVIGEEFLRAAAFLTVQRSDDLAKREGTLREFASENADAPEF